MNRRIAVVVNLLAVLATSAFADDKAFLCSELLATNGEASVLAITVTSIETCRSGACNIDWAPHRNGTVRAVYQVDDPAIRSETGVRSLTVELSVTEDARFRAMTQGAFDPDEQVYRLLEALVAKTKETGRKTVVSSRFDVEASTGQFILAHGDLVSPAEPENDQQIFGSRLDMEQLLKAQESLRHTRRVPNTSPASHVLMIASSVPGEPFLPGELTVLMNSYADTIRSEKAALELQGYDFSQGLPEVPDIVQAIKVSPDPARPGRFLVFEVTLHTARATSADGQRWDP